MPHVEEHMLGAAEADARGPVLQRHLGVLGRVGVGGHPQLWWLLWWGEGRVGPSYGWVGRCDGEQALFDTLANFWDHERMVWKLASEPGGMRGTSPSSTWCVYVCVCGKGALAA